jgi:hypothetical protein
MSEGITGIKELDTEIVLYADLDSLIHLSKLNKYTKNLVIQSIPRIIDKYFVVGYIDELVSFVHELLENDELFLASEIIQSAEIHKTIFSGYVSDECDTVSEENSDIEEIEYDFYDQLITDLLENSRKSFLIPSQHLLENYYIMTPNNYDWSLFYGKYVNILNYFRHHVGGYKDLNLQINVIRAAIVTKNKSLIEKIIYYATGIGISYPASQEQKRSELKKLLDQIRQLYPIK